MAATVFVLAGMEPVGEDDQLAQSDYDAIRSPEVSAWVVLGLAAGFLMPSVESHATVGWTVLLGATSVVVGLLQQTIP